MANSRRIAVLGTGYVGLAVAAGLAFMRHEVVCSDIEVDKIHQLSLGVVPIVEEGLPELISDMLATGRLRFTNSNLAAIEHAEFVFLCLPTPAGLNGRADLSVTMTVVTEIAPHLAPESVVINKSTVPVGTAHKLRNVLNRPDIDVVSNPEFLSEGSAVLHFLQPDRIVIGSDSPDAGRRVAELYGDPTSRKCIVTDTLSAELIKYASNAFLATRITFINTIAEYCESVGADIRTVAAGIGADHRIGTEFLSPGPGWGGSCFPKDTEALVHMAEETGCDVSLVKTVILANGKHTDRIAAKVAMSVGGDLTNKRVAVWGLAFKAGTSDLRSSPAMTIVRTLQRRGALIRAFDPTIDVSSVGLDVAATKEDACVDADVLLVTTEWPEFSNVDFPSLSKLMKKCSIVDARNVMNMEAARRAGFQYVGVGLSQSMTTAPATLSNGPANR